MKTKIFAVILFVGLFAGFSKINAQQQEPFRIDKPFVAKYLSGVITNQFGEEIPNATVTISTKNWKSTSLFVKANNKGIFRFKNLPIKLIT